jgi:hypothetical protein
LIAAGSMPEPIVRGSGIFDCDPAIADTPDARHGQLDLLRPMAATVYFTEPGFHALIHNPAAVRHWPAQQMPAFNNAMLPDSAIDAAIAYLRYLAARSK